MVSVDDIPAEVKWEIAAKSSMDLAMGYSAAMRQVLNDKVADELEETVWAEGGKGIAEIASSIGLPTGNAQEVENAWDVVGAIVMPGIEAEVVESSPDRVVDKITSCSTCSQAKEEGIPTEAVCRPCRAFNKNAIEALNPSYTQHFTKRMCLGDNYCEAVIEKKHGITLEAAPAGYHEEEE
ncbi:hypothetical protein DSECCO2_53670 [anaerobic digester metagenome]